MPSIIEFLTARLDEDEAVAKAATAGPWTTDDPLLSDWVGSRAIGAHIADCSAGQGFREGSIQDAAHIARHNPARVLREIAAKRHLLEWCVEATQHLDWATINRFGSLLHDPNTRATYTAILAIQAMAAPYADHPDYDPAWTVA